MADHTKLPGVAEAAAEAREAAEGPKSLRRAVPLAAADAAKLHELLLEHLELQGLDAERLGGLRAALEEATSYQESVLSHLVSTASPHQHAAARRASRSGNEAPASARGCDVASAAQAKEEAEAAAQAAAAQAREEAAPRGWTFASAAADESPSRCSEESSVKESPAKTLPTTSPTDELAASSLAPEPQRRTEGGRCGALLMVLFPVALCLVYLPSLTYSEWYIDEPFAAVRNADARGETSLESIFSHDFWGNTLWGEGWTHKSYRPLVILSYAGQYWFNGGTIKPQPLRAFNVALHVTNVCLLLALLRRKGASRSWAALAASLFAAQPVHAENAIYLVGRADSMATFCWLLALLTWPRTTRRAKGWLSTILRLLLAALLAVVGGLCKESGFCVLAQLAALEFMGPRPQRGVPALLVFGGVFAARSWLTDGTAAGFSYVDTPVQYHENRLVRTATYLYHHGKYAQLMVLPWELSWEYSYNSLPLLEATWRDVRTLAALVAYLGLVASACWALSRRRRSALSGVANVIIPFVPASNLFFVVGVAVGERLLYPCNVGAACFVAALGSSTSGSKRRSCCFCLRPFFLFSVLVGVYVYRLGIRVQQWSSKDALFTADATAYPQSSKLRHQLGTILHAQDRLDEALVHYNASLSIFRHSALTEYVMAQIYIETNRAAEAEARFDSILSGHGMGFGSYNLWALYVDYGFTLMLRKRFQDAVPALIHGLSLNEDVPHGLNALGYTYVQLKMFKEAVDAFARGLHYDPTNAALMNNIGVAMMMSGQHQAGADFIAKALEIEPGAPSIAFNGRLLHQMINTGQWPAQNFQLELFYNRGT